MLPSMTMMNSSRSDMPMEYICLFGRKWRPIPGFDEYFASDDGEILSLAKSRNKPRIMNQFTSSDGHKYVFLYKNKKQTKMFVHRAVLMAWIGMPGPDEEGRHLNDRPSENNLENLAWGTRQENIDDKRRNGGIPIGERSGAHKVNEIQVLEIRRRYAMGESSYDLSAEYDISKNAVLKIVNGKSWSHLPTIPAKSKHSCARKKPMSEEEKARSEACLRKYAASIKKERKMIPCACGCGQMIVSVDNKGRAQVCARA